jgi:hypothetical protein
VEEVEEDVGNNCFVELDDVNESPLDLVDVEFAVPGLESLALGVLGNEVGVGTILLLWTLVVIPPPIPIPADNTRFGVLCAESDTCLRSPDNIL